MSELPDFCASHKIHHATTEKLAQELSDVFLLRHKGVLVVHLTCSMIIDM